MTIRPPVQCHPDRVRHALAGDPGRIGALDRDGRAAGDARSSCSSCCSSSARRLPRRFRWRFGAAAVLCTRGCLSLAAPHFAIDGFALTVATMMGLGARGRLRAADGLALPRGAGGGGGAAAAAALRTRRTAGRTTAFAGSTLLLAMVVIVWIMPGSLFLSLAGTAILVTRHQRRDRHRRRAAAALPARPQRQPLAARLRATTASG